MKIESNNGGNRLKKKITDIIYELSEPILKKHNFEFVDAEYKKEMDQWYLRLFIDKEGGITVDDCQIVSEQLSQVLDEVDPIEHSYIFEVSSPGIERPLKNERDFKRNLGKELEIKFYKPQFGKKILKGILVDYDEEKIKVNSEDEILEIDKSIIAIIKPFIKF